MRWTAPEALFYKKYSTANDVWSYGCLFYEICHEPMERLQISEVFSLSHANYCLVLQVIKCLSSGQHLSPPPGCPEIVYKLMIQ